MAYWRKPWDKINEGRASRKTQKQFIAAYYTMKEIVSKERGKNAQQQGQGEVQGDSGVEELQKEDATGQPE